MTNDKNLGTSAQLQDPNYEVPMGPRIALGMQHVLAMFASNVTPSIIIAGAATTFCACIFLPAYIALAISIACIIIYF